MKAIVRRFATFARRLPGGRPFRLALSLVALLLSVVLAADALRLDSDREARVAESRAAMSESLAVQLSTLASVADYTQLERSIAAFVQRNGDVVAAALNDASGGSLSAFGDAGRLDTQLTASTLTHVTVPILRGTLPWGHVQVVFDDRYDGWRRIVWLGFVLFGTLISFTLFLNRALVQLDPGRSVPGRVDTAFNLFDVGVLILDDASRVVMANTAARALLEGEGESMIGRTLDSAAWRPDGSELPPWQRALTLGAPVDARMMELISPDKTIRQLRIACSRIGNEEDDLAGVLVTLDDLTDHEIRNRELQAAMVELRRSEESITAKNRELERLATTDALTGIANRRVLREILESAFSRAMRERAPLAVVMCDIDHFKSVNDQHGHAVGDDVIVAVARTLSSACRDYDLAGRYGGEEFVLVLPGLDAEAAAEVAERIRIGVISLVASEGLPLEQLSASFGVADLGAGAADSGALLEQADRALYVSKQGGRNRVTIHDSGITPMVAPSPALEVEQSAADRANARVLELEAVVQQRSRDLASLREFDVLTGMPMRALFLKRLQTELQRGRRIGCITGVLSVEMRELNRALASFGHEAVDALLVAFVDRLQDELRSTDLAVEIGGSRSISRIMSNEFGVLLTDLADESGALIVVSRIRRALARPFAVGQAEVYLGASVGVALSGPSAGEQGDRDADEPAPMLERASEARNLAALRPDKVAFVHASRELDERARDFLLLESELRQAIDRDELDVYFQPKLDLRERRVVGFEALLRWRHAERGFVPPDVFVGVAESSGMIAALSSCVLRHVVARLREWSDLGLDSLSVAINISPMQLGAAHMVDEILAALDEAGLEGRQLEVELTETSVLADPDKASEVLSALRDASVRVSLDDFGTGYTSLSQLATLPLDALKIDRAFVGAIDADPRNRAIVESTITLAHALGMRVVAEGVETQQQLMLLGALDCDLVQGYLIARPMPADEATAFLLAQRRSEHYRAA